MGTQNRFITYNGGQRLLGRRRSTFQAVCLSAMCLAACGGAARAAPDNQPEGNFLERHRAVVTLELAGGHSDNVFLTPTNPVGDIFLESSASLEHARQPTDSLSLYLATTLETRRHLRAREADDLLVEADAQLILGRPDLALTLYDALSYEDYQVFDENGDPLPQGPSSATDNSLSLGASSSPGSRFHSEAAIIYRTKNYTRLALDFHELGAGAAVVLAVAAATDATLTADYRGRAYRDLPAAATDGTVLETNPTSREAITAVGFDLSRDLPRGGSTGVRADFLSSIENFAGEGSYTEIGGGGRACVAVGTKIALEGEVDIRQRGYANRLVPDTNEKQQDAFLDISLTVEFAVWRTVSIFSSATHSQRRSNHGPLSYEQSSFMSGFRGVL